MEAKQPDYSPSTAETQAVILDWVRATEEFHRRYYQINEVINGVYRNQYQRSAIDGNRKTKMRNLLRLRQHMSDVLMTLLTDMTSPKPVRQRDGGQTSPSKPGQLMSHTRLLQDLNREVDSELRKLTLWQTQAQA